MSKLALSALTAVALSFSTGTLANIYVTTGAYYSKADNASDQTGPGTAIAIGYEINPMWSIEFGYDNLIDEEGSKPNLINYPQTTALDFEDSYHSKGWTLSALGKTQVAPSTTLFYRAGLMQADVRQNVYSQGSQVCKGQPDQQLTYLYVDPDGKTFQSATGCEYKQNSTDLVFGLGLQNDFSENWFGRIEAVHVFADKGEAITAAKLSIGYRF